MACGANTVGSAKLGPYEVLSSIYGVCVDSDANSNKFYAVELQKSNADSKYAVYVRYGRVGGSATEKEYHPGTAFTSEYEARAEYQDRIKDKMGAPTCSACRNKDVPGTMSCTKCSRKYNFQDYTKKYVPVDLAQAKVGSATGNSRIDTAKVASTAQIVVSAPVAVDSRPTMDVRIARFLDHIYVEAGRAVSQSLNTGALRASAENPLGTLSTAQIDSGIDIIDQIRGHIVAGSLDLPYLMKMTAGWYSTIPQNVGLRPAWDHLRIDTLDKVNRAIDLMDLLKDVKGVQDTYRATSGSWDKYDAVGADIVALERGTDEYDRIERMSLTVSPAHQRQYGRASVRGVYKIRVGAHKPATWFDPRNLGNHEEMFHGSRNANMVGIMSKGLLLRPPGAIITGSMFGNGVYASPNDCASKSMQYADGAWSGSNQSRNFYLFVMKVAQGRVMKYYDAQPHLVKAPTGYDSVRGVKGRSLIHDEHIIYDLQQHRLDYVVDIDPGR
jgi:poly [ADP-ribose] polymerase